MVIALQIQSLRHIIRAGRRADNFPENPSSPQTSPVGFSLASLISALRSLWMICSGLKCPPPIVVFPGSCESVSRHLASLQRAKPARC